MKKKNPGAAGTAHRADDDAGMHHQHGPSDSSCPPPLEPDLAQSLLDVVIAYAAAGLVIVPTNHDKVALIKWKKIDRAPTEAEVRRWWRKWPDAWIGLLTGHRSDLDVVDLDHKADKNGFNAVPDWAELTPVTAQTPSGSVHLYFKASGTRTTGSFIAPGVDTRGEGGLVILPPSGGRTWRTGSLPTDLDLPNVPDRLRPAARERKPRQTQTNGGTPPKGAAEHAGKGVEPIDMAELRAALFAVSPDDYDNWFTCLAALKNDLGEAGRAFALEWTEQGIGENWQARRINRFDDKWDKDLVDVTEIHLGSIFHLATQANPDWRDGIEPDEEPSTHAEQPEADADDPSAKRISPIPLFWPGEEAADETGWRVKGLIPEIGSGILAARRGAGKTFVAIDIAYALARLKTYIGKNIVGNVGTLWIAKEAPGQIPLRLRGLPDEPGQWPFRYIKTCPRLLDGKGRANIRSVDDIIATVKVASDEMIERFGMPVGFVAIDTMRKAAGYGDRGENDPSQTGNVMQALSDIAVETRSFVLGVDHMGHDTSRGARGGTSKEDDADLVLYLDGEHGKGTMIVEKVRDGIDSIGVEYECVVVELGLDQDGDPVTTCRVELGDPKQAERSERTSKMTKLLETPPRARGVRKVESIIGSLPLLGREQKGWCR